MAVTEPTMLNRRAGPDGTIVTNVEDNEIAGTINLVKGVRRLQHPRYPNDPKKFVERPIAYTRAEAVASKGTMDWYDPNLKVWLRGGRKAERDIYDWQQDSSFNFELDA